MKISSKILATMIAAGSTISYAHAETNLKLVEVLTSPERTETLKSIVHQFETQNPGTHVEIISLPWSEAFQKFSTMISSGDVPDVVEMPDNWLALYAKNKQLASLEPWLAKWQYTSDLTDQALKLGRSIDNQAYMLPYGLYLRGMFYNKKIFSEAGISEPPKTMDEFVADAKQIKDKTGKAGYCLRGGSGGMYGWMMFGAAMAGQPVSFDKDGKSNLNSDGWKKGFSWVVDLYKQGLAPKDSVNWGFNEVVAGFYSGNCAMLDQDPDALIAINGRMKDEDFGVAPMPKGPSGKAFPTIGFVGWSIMQKSEHKDLAWKLLATLEGPQGNMAWNKKVGTLPVLKSLEKDPFYASPKFKGWFDELADPNVVPMKLPIYLQEFAYFKDVYSLTTSQKALLGEFTPDQLADSWDTYFTKAQKKYLASK